MLHVNLIRKTLGRFVKFRTNSLELEEVVAHVLSSHPEMVEKYQHGLSRLQIRGFFVGMVMQATKGRCKLADIKSLLKEMLESN